MNNQPIKVIWKYKNNNKRIHYNTYIFVGTVPKDVNRVLDTIQEYTLYETFVKLSKQEYNIMEKFYGVYWYRSFFNTYHINAILLNIRENKIQKKEFLDKYGKDWVDTHIDNGVIIEKKIIYSYESIIKNEVDRKTQKKERQIGLVDDETDMDYKTTIKKELEDIFYKTLQRTRTKTKQNKELLQSGGGSGDIEDGDNTTNPTNNNEDVDIDENPFEPVEGNDQDELMGDDEELDLTEIEELYKDIDVDPDKNVDKTTDLIKQVIKDDKIFDKKNNIMEQFDNSKDTSIHDTILKEVHNKIYVKSNISQKNIV